MTACVRCGTFAEAEATEITPIGWSWTPTERGIEWMCPACTRDNVRSIEAKLPEEWW
jgi:predicted RNA-binding Zn-ribbon protein involved in translation (DUF1610 family)